MKDSIYGLISKDFHIEILENLCVSGGIQTGPFGSQLHQRDYLSVGTPIITVEHLGENRILHQDLPCVSDEDKERLSRYMMQKGDIIFSRVGSVDRRALVRDEEDGWLFSGRCLRVRPDKSKVDSGYLSWFFGFAMFKDYIRRVAVGATMPSLNTDLLSKVPVIVPPLPEQRAIAAVLGALDDEIQAKGGESKGMRRILNHLINRLVSGAWSVEEGKAWLATARRLIEPLDDKIELNRRMNRTLEAIAQAVFRHWFVENEEAEGWEIKTLGDICEFAYGKGLKEEERVLGPIPVYGSNGQIGWHNEPLVKGPGIVVGRKGNPGIVTWVHTDFFPIDTTFYVEIKDKETSLYWLYYMLVSLNLSNLAADSAVPGLNRNFAYMSELVYPPTDLMKKFDDVIKPLFAKIHANEQQSRTLAALRDALLPKLMRGEVRVAVHEEGHA